MYIKGVSSEPPSAPAVVRKRVRAPEVHREAILEAARAAFAERGYTRATIREIAGRAGVTHGLVMRHFGSKEQLFLAAVPGPGTCPNCCPARPRPCRTGSHGPSSNAWNTPTATIRSSR